MTGDSRLDALKLTLLSIKLGVNDLLAFCRQRLLRAANLSMASLPEYQLFHLCSFIAPFTRRAILIVVSADVRNN